MNPLVLILIILLYFGLLIFISFATSKGAQSTTFYDGDRKSPWYLVAFGMIGASLSGVTFVSVPGTVESNAFSYMQMTLGFVIGYIVIAFVLMPIYYRLNLVSIYSFLEDRLGITAYKISAGFFLVSRSIGAALRLYLASSVLHFIIVDVNKWPVPYEVTVLVTLAMIWLYTFRGGIKTVVWTDSIQTALMLVAMVITIFLILKEMNWSFGDVLSQVKSDSMGQWFFMDDFNGGKFFPKQLIGGAIMAIAMTGLDQDMMQKNLTCKNLKSAQLNMMTFSVVLVVVNFCFLLLGFLLYKYQALHGVKILDLGGSLKDADLLFASVSANHLGAFALIIFTLGVIAAAYSSADSALTSLTTSFSYDFLNAGENEISPQRRKLIHLSFSGVIFVLILLFKLMNDDSIVWTIFKMASYTYGPILGLFIFAIFTKHKVMKGWLVLPVIVAPVLCYVLNAYSKVLLGGYSFGFELLLLNGLLTFLGCYLLREKN